MTPTSTPLATESRTVGGFYVPRFQVLIDGENLPRDVQHDIRSVTYEDSINDIDSFTLEVNNWDDVSRSFRYIGSETAAELEKNHPEYGRRTLFEPCGKEVEIRLGYGDQLVTMVRGAFTTMSPSFTDSDAQLTVTGLNALHQLRRKQYSTTWRNKKDSEIAQDLARRTDAGRKRFPLPIVVDTNAMQNEKPAPEVTQHNQYDIDFLLQRARVRGYVVFVQEADPTSKRPRQLYFGPSRPGMVPGLREVKFQLTWGRSLSEFKPRLSTANQIQSVTVRGWNRTRREPVSRTVTLKDPRLKVNEDLYRLLTDCDEREEIVVDEPVFTNCQARERAIAILHHQITHIVTAEDVKVVGLPDLRAGQVVVIDGVGARLSGEYFVTRTRHTLTPEEGYLTTFNCRREQPAGRSSS